MPHFENLDQYETKNPKSGKRHIVPIAPHSLQAADYHPGDGGSEPPRKRKRISEFRKMEFEPVSIRQMEKEFKAAGRKRRRSHSKRKRKSFWKSVKQFFLSLFTGKDKASASRGNRRRQADSSGKSRNRKRNPAKGEQKGAHKGQHPKKKAFNKRRPGKNRKQPSRQNQQKNAHGQQPGSKQSGNKQPGEGSGEKPARKRNRRNRKRRQSSGSKGNPHSGNQKQG